MNVTIYTKPEKCIQCDMVKRWLNANSVPYEELNALDHMEMLVSTGIRNMPIVDVGDGELFGGFNIGRLEKAKAESSV